jgi:serine/threonine protein kinase
MSHGDLKPENILYVNDKLRLADFGMSCLIVAKQFNSHGGIPDCAVGGTESYIDPMLKLGRKMSKASDIYSLGVIIYELIMRGQKYMPRFVFRTCVPNRDDFVKIYREEYKTHVKSVYKKLHGSPTTGLPTTQPLLSLLKNILYPFPSSSSTTIRMDASGIVEFLSSNSTLKNTTLKNTTLKNTTLKNTTLNTLESNANNVNAPIRKAQTQVRQVQAQATPNTAKVVRDVIQPFTEIDSNPSITTCVNECYLCVPSLKNMAREELVIHIYQALDELEKKKATQSS